MVLRRLDVVRVFWEEVEGSSAGFGALDVLDNGLKVVRGKTPRTFVTEEGLNNRNLKGLNLTWFCFWGL